MDSLNNVRLMEQISGIILDGKRFNNHSIYLKCGKIIEAAGICKGAGCIYGETIRGGTYNCNLTDIEKITALHGKHRSKPKKKPKRFIKYKTREKTEGNRMIIDADPEQAANE